MVEQWWCVENTLCTAILAGGGSAAIAFCRHLSRYRIGHSKLTELRRIVGISGFCGMLSTGVSLIGLELYPGHPHLIIGSVLVVFSLVDPTTSEGRQWLLSKVSGLTRVLLRSLSDTLKKFQGTLLDGNDDDEK